MTAATDPGTGLEEVPVNERRGQERGWGARSQNPVERIQRLAWVPVPVFTLAIVLLKASGSSTSLESPVLVLVLNLLFLMIASYLVAMIAGRSFLANGSPWLLMTGSGMVIWGTTGLVAAVGEAQGPHFLVASHNLGVLISSVLHFAGALLLLRPEWKLRTTGIWLPAAFAVAFGCAGLVAVTAHEGWLPVFFVPGQGGTPLRQAVLGIAILLLALTAMLIRSTAGRTTTVSFRSWYSWGLTLLAVGLAGVLAQTATDDMLGWTGRAAQYLGGVYMIIAAASAMRESGSWNIPMDEVLSASREQVRLFIEHAPAALAMFDRDMRYLVVSRRWMADYGLSDRSIIGRSHYDIFPEIPQRWKEVHQRGLAGEVVREDNDRIERSDGRIQWMSWEVRPWYTLSGRIGGIIIFTEDITKRREAEGTVTEKEQQLRGSYDLWEAVTKGTGVIIAAQDTDLRYTYFNTAYAEEMKKLTGKDIAIGMSMADLFDHMPEQERVAVDEWNKVLRGESSQKTLEFGDPGRHRVHYHVLHTPLRDGDGNVIGAGEVASDISGLVHAQKRLAYLASFPQLNPNPVLETDLGGIVTYANAAAEDTLERAGRARTETHLFVPGDLGDIIAAWDRKRPAIVAREITVDGLVFRVAVYLSAELEVVRLYAYDVTESKRADGALRRSEEQYRSLFDNMINGFSYHQIVLNEEGKPIDYVFLEVNEAFERLTGLRREDIIGKRVTEVLPGIEKDPADWIGTYGKVALKGRAVRFDRYADALGKWYSVSAYSPARGQFAAVFEDISVRKFAEQALQESERKFFLLFQKAGFGAALATFPDGVFIDINEAVERMFGYSRQEVIGKTSLDLDLYPDPGLRSRIIAQLTEQGMVRDVEVILRTKSREERSFLMNMIRLELGGRQHYIVTLVDITERKLAEDARKSLNEELEQRVAVRTAELRNLQAHIEAVREGERAHIAREVHDQLGQVMTALKMDIAWLQRNYPSADAAVRERSEEMRELIDGAISSVKRITSELRPSVLDDFGLQAVVEWAAQEFGKRSGVICRVSSHPLSFTMDRTRATVMYRVLQESLTNIARHAGARDVTITMNLEDERFHMTIEDNGKGIPPEKIDDPASYGLMSMRERLRHLGGTLTICGRSGGGTTITASIPLSGAGVPAGEAPKGTPDADLPEGGTNA